MASHLPVNHHMRAFWRVLTFFAGLYVLLFGIVGLNRTSGMSTFAIHGERALGLTTNPGFAIASIVVGALIVATTIIGRNIDVPVNIVLAVLFIIAGLFSLAFLRTDLNYFAFSVTNCVVSYVVGTILLMSFMYGRVDRRATPRSANQRANA
jgi:hypothetical protein